LRMENVGIDSPEKRFELDYMSAPLDVQDVYLDLKLKAQLEARKKSGSNKPVRLDLPTRKELFEKAGTIAKCIKETGVDPRLVEAKKAERGWRAREDADDQYEETMREAFKRAGISIPGE